MLRFLPSSSLRLWLKPVYMVGGAAAVLYTGLFLIDYATGATGGGDGPLGLFIHYDAETAQNALGNLASVVVAVLGIVITVVSIVVQLAANRYTPRIADMFFRDRTNLGVLGFFVTICICSVLVSLSVSQAFLPRRSINAILFLVCFSLLIMIPYFAYVFDFLDPEKIVSRIEKQALGLCLSGKERISARQRGALQCVEHLSDIAVNAVSNKDKIIASSAVNALKDLATSYLPLKRANPEAWFEIGESLRENPDFVAMTPESLSGLCKSRAWLEWIILRQYQAIYREALEESPDINYLLAIDTRYLGESAVLAGDLAVLKLTVKFFNTFMRVTLNAHKVRTAYNLLNQYRHLAEQLIHSEHREMIVEIAGYLRYYSHVAQGMGQGFVAETIAYDISTLCEVSFFAGIGLHEKLLDFLLNIDQAAETEAQEVTLRGVRKAQVKLASAYLMRGAEEFARRIYADMQDERPERLRSIRDELLGITSKDFWEVIDRGTNFDYLDEPRKEKLRDFFTWFKGLKEAPAT